MKTNSKIIHIATINLYLKGIEMIKVYVITVYATLKHSANSEKGAVIWTKNEYKWNLFRVLQNSWVETF